MTQQFDSGAMAYTHYQALGITRDATLEDIKKAYRALARKYHPDVSKEKNTDVKMQIINIAYDILSNATKKNFYDLSLNAPQILTPSHRYTPPHQYTQYHEDFAPYTKQVEPVRGADQFAQIEIPLDIAYHGAVQNISILIPSLNGSGEAELQRKTLQVSIPKGLKHGQLIRLSKQGEKGQFGGVSGDLYLEVFYKESENLHINGADIYYSINISPWEAALGQDIEVQTPSGKIKVTIPKNTIYGKQLRLKGKGIPASLAGHLYLVLNIVYPKTENEQQANAYQDFANAFSQFDPRSN